MAEHYCRGCIASDCDCGQFDGDNCTYCDVCRGRVHHRQASLEWQPIASAPKHETVIGYAITDPERWMRVGLGQVVVNTTSKPEGEWMWHWDYRWPTATHWTPLPSPPVGSHGNQSLSEASGSAQSEAQKD